MGEGVPRVLNIKLDQLIGSSQRRGRLLQGNRKGRGERCVWGCLGGRQLTMAPHPKRHQSRRKNRADGRFDAALPMQSTGTSNINFNSPPLPPPLGRKQPRALGTRAATKSHPFLAPLR